jgi:hypothetical protein
MQEPAPSRRNVRYRALIRTWTLESGLPFLEAVSSYRVTLSFKSDTVYVVDFQSLGVQLESQLALIVTFVKG